MENIVSKITEIESTTEKIMEHVASEKAALDKEFADKEAAFIKETDDSTEGSLSALREKFRLKINEELAEEKLNCMQTILKMKEDFASNKEQYADQIFRRITEVK